MKFIDFNNTKPNFINGNFKWYVDENIQKYIESQQANNLPKLENLYCFIVKGDDVSDYVLIDNKQNVIAGYSYTIEGYDQILTEINIIKISKYFN